LRLKKQGDKRCALRDAQGPTEASPVGALQRAQRGRRGQGKWVRLIEQGGEPQGHSVKQAGQDEPAVEEQSVGRNVNTERLAFPADCWHHRLGSRKESERKRGTKAVRVKV
jgi:hypothetical protein